MKTNPKMALIRATLIAVITAASATLGPASLADEQANLNINADGSGNSVTVTGRSSRVVYSGAPAAPGSGGVVANTGTGGAFDEAAARLARLSYAMCVGTRASANTGAGTVLLDPADCATDTAPTTTAQAADGTIVAITITSTDVSTLLADGSGITRQPPGPEVLLSKDFIVYTNPDTQVLTTTVAGTTVTIHATPTSYTWNWGDGTTTTTTDPGAPWPTQTITHRYTHTAQNTTTTLTTTWSATYTPNGGTTTPIVGTITTTNTTTPYNIIRTTTYLTDQAETQQRH